LLCALFFLDDWQVFIKFLHLCWKKTWNQPQTGALGHQKPRPSPRPLGITWKEIQGFLKSLQPIWCQFQSCSFRQFLWWWICFLEILSLDFVEDKQMPISMIIFTLLLLASGRALKATLDEGPRSRDQWIHQAILLIESIKLVPRPFRWGSKTKKWQMEAKPTRHLLWRENPLVWTKKPCKRRASQLENQESGYGPRYSSPTQGFNLLQIIPNWFQGSCRVEPHLKLAYVYTIAVLGVLGSCSTQEAASPSAFVLGLCTRLQQAGYGKKVSCVSLPEPCYGT
jgi:hypothetical protein